MYWTLTLYTIQNSYQQINQWHRLPSFLTVQHECIPQAVLGMDIICQAKSGMGKTAVFVLATLHKLQPVDGEVHVIVLCHTRELAYQIQREYERFSKYLPEIRSRVFYGGGYLTDLLSEWLTWWRLNEIMALHINLFVRHPFDSYEIDVMRGMVDAHVLFFFGPIHASFSTYCIYHKTLLHFPYLNAIYLSTIPTCLPLLSSFLLSLYLLCSLYVCHSAWCRSTAESQHRDPH